MANETREMPDQNQIPAPGNNPVDERPTYRGPDGIDIPAGPDWSREDRSDGCRGFFDVPSSGWTI